MKFSSISKVAAATVLGGVLFTGCGVDDNPITTESVSGTGLAAYINNGTVFADCNKNGVLDSGEVNSKTTATGTFSLTVDSAICPTYNIVIIGGTNSETGATINYPTIAKKGSTKVSPLTTMLVDANAADTTTILANLGLTSDALNEDYNTFGDIAKKVNAIKSIIETTLAATGASNAADIAKIAKAINNAIKAVGTNLNLETAAATLTSQIATEVKKDTSIASSTLDAALATAATNAQKIATATTSTAFNTAKTEAENATKDATPAKLVLGSTLTVGSSTATLTNGTFSTTVDTNNNSKVADFYNVALNSATLTKDINGTEEVSISVKITDKDVTGDNVTLSINPVNLTSTGKKLSITIPTNSTVTVQAQGLASLGTAPMTSTVTADIVNTDLGVNVSSLLGKLNTTSVATQITALNSYLATANTYDV